MNDIRLRLDETGGGATVTVDGQSETYTYALGNAVSRFGTLALLGGEPGVDGGEEIYKERLRAEFLSEIRKHGLSDALRRMWDISREDCQ